MEVSKVKDILIQEIENKVLEKVEFYNSHDYSDFITNFSIYELGIFTKLHRLIYPNARDMMRAEEICNSACILYMAVEMHNLASKYEYSKLSNYLEMHVLGGDLFSGYFAQEFVKKNDFKILRDWLDYFIPFLEQLTNLSIDKKDISEKKLFHLNSLINQLIYFGDKFPDLGEIPLAVKEHTDVLSQCIFTGDFTEYKKIIFTHEDISIVDEIECLANQWKYSSVRDLLKNRNERVR